MSRVAQILTMIAGAAAVTTALAQTPTQPQTTTTTAVFESLDKNADGKVTLAEASTNDDLFVAFKALDKDKNGELSKEEFAGYQPKKRGAS
jgi:Ca2+-binding EF-hand superfamily protein